MVPFGFVETDKRRRPLSRRYSVAVALALSLAWLPIPAATAAVLSSECRVPDEMLSLSAPLPTMAAAVVQERALKVLVLGPALAGSGNHQRGRSRLQKDLELRLAGVKVEILDERRGSALVQDDFARIRHEVIRNDPDLVVWQVGTSDAVAGVDPEVFSVALARAARWIKEQRVDLVLMDPVFIPFVDHEKVYLQIVDRIGRIASTENVGLFRRYALTGHLESERQKAQGDGTPGERRACTSQLLAEALVLSLGR